MTESKAGSGRRIAILGPTGSGKSRLGHRLGEKLGVRVVELDALFHQPNWQPTPVEEFREKVVGALDDDADAWICVGNYTSMVGNIVLPRAETILWLRERWRRLSTARRRSNSGPTRRLRISFDAHRRELATTAIEGRL